MYGHVFQPDINLPDPNVKKTNSIEKLQSLKAQRL